MLKQLLLLNQGAYSEPEEGSVFTAMQQSILLLIETQNMSFNLIIPVFSWDQTKTLL